MKTTKKQREVLKTYLAQFSAGTAKEAALVIDDIDTLESENARLREALSDIIHAAMGLLEPLKVFIPVGSLKEYEKIKTLLKSEVEKQ